jgi:hypothetical protein
MVSSKSEGESSFLLRTKKFIKVNDSTWCKLVLNI